MWKELAFLCYFICTSSAKITEKQYASMPDLFHLDDYDKCMMFGDEALYCFSTYELQPLHPKNPPEIWNVIQEVSSQRTNYRHDHLRHGICITTHCSNVTRSTSSPPNEDLELHKQINECYDAKYAKLGLKGVITKIHCETIEPVYPIDWIDILVAVVAVAYLSFVIFASLYEGTARYKTPEEYEKITGTQAGKLISAFSIPKNWMRLKTVKETEDIKSLKCIQGVRFYNMVCVIMAHSVMTIFAGPVSNPLYTEKMTEKFLNMFLANGGYAVQTFFLISGWLLTYHFFLAFEGKKEIKFKFLVMAFINRYLRLTPTLAVMVIFHSTWLVHLSRGPTWDNIIGQEYRNCRSNGWTNLLYLNTYIDNTHMCLPHTWYMGIDFIFFTAQLIFLYLMIKNPRKITFILATAFACLSALIFSISYINNYDLLYRLYPERLYLGDLIKQREFYFTMGSPWNNGPGALFGILFGYLHYIYRDVQLFTTKKSVVIWWFFALFLPLGSLFFQWHIFYDENYEHDPVKASIAAVVFRMMFVGGIAWVMWGHTKGIGWITKFIVEWKPLYILGRLTFCIFLTHVSICGVDAATIRNSSYNNDNILFSKTVEVTAKSVMAATILCLLVESPASQVINILMSPQIDKIEKSDKKKT